MPSSGAVLVVPPDPKAAGGRVDLAALLSGHWNAPLVPDTHHGDSYGQGRIRALRACLRGIRTPVQRACSLPSDRVLRKRRTGLLPRCRNRTNTHPWGELAPTFAASLQPLFPGCSPGTISRNTIPGQQAARPCPLDPRLDLGLREPEYVRAESPASFPFRCQRSTVSQLTSRRSATSQVRRRRSLTQVRLSVGEHGISGIDF